MLDWGVSFDLGVWRDVIDEFGSVSKVILFEFVIDRVNANKLVFYFSIRVTNCGLILSKVI